MFVLSICPPAMGAALWSGTVYALTVVGLRPTPITLGRACLAVPFDAVRFQYACAVWSGLRRPSLVEAGKLESAIVALEQVLLGPVAWWES